MIVTECLRTGGAQVFALRMLKYLSKDHEVILYYLHKELINEKMVTQFEVGHSIRSGDHFLNLPFKLIDKVLRRLKSPYLLREELFRYSMYKLAKTGKVDLIHSNMFKADNIASQVAKKLSIPIVITMHGSYENFLKSTLGRKGEVIPGYLKKLTDHLRRVDGIAYLTQKNLEAPHYILSQTKNFEMPPVRKIYNGFYSNFYEPKKRDELGISDEDMVFGMVARAIPEKGWEYAIDAFNDLNDSSHLVLVGGGPLLNNLEKNNENDQIHFVGLSPNPLEWISIFDVGLLPSLYDESLPNVIVEYLHLNVPVIATDIGETPEMIKTDFGDAGRIIDTSDTGRVREILTGFMKDFKNMDRDVLSNLKSLAGQASKKFSMSECISSYEKFYEYLLKNE
ncbi:MAG: glycosyltransferase family 4 protein [Cyclobacteriaceae bacterium]